MVIIGIVNYLGVVYSKKIEEEYNTPFHSEYYPLAHAKRWRFFDNLGFRFTRGTMDDLDEEDMYNIEKHLYRKYKIKVE